MTASPRQDLPPAVHPDGHAASDAPRGAGTLPASVFELIVERNMVPFVVIDPVGTAIYASATTEEVLGWPASEIVGRNIIEFLEPGDTEFAVAALAELNSIDRMASGIPVVLPVRLPAGGTVHVEVAALSLLDEPGLELFVLRLRPYEAEHHRGAFVESLLTAEDPAAVLRPLTRSLAASFEAVGVSVHHDFDGVGFAGVVGSWDGAGSLPCHAGPWATALAGTSVVEVSADPALHRSTGAVAGWLVPVPARDGASPAVLSLWRDRPDPPLAGHRRAFAEAAALVTLALVRVAEHQRLVHLAGHDPLTGVANRATFRGHLAEALAAGEDVAVGFCDLDGFKQVNDAHGHGAGDGLLVEVAERIRHCLRSEDELARMGGDEFTILWRGIPDEEAAARLAARVVATAVEPFAVPGGTAEVGLSVGVALAGPGATAEALLALADGALYESKQSGGRRATTRTFVSPGQTFDRRGTVTPHP